MTPPRGYTFKVRTEGSSKPRSNLKRKRDMLLEECANYKPPSDCCSSFECGKKVSVGYVRTRREEFIQMNQSTRKDTLRTDHLRFIHSCDDPECAASVGDGPAPCSGSGSSRRDNPIWKMGGHRVCSTFMRDVLDASNFLLDSVKCTPCARVQSGCTRTPRHQAVFKKEDEVVRFLDHLTEASDLMPDKDEIRIAMTRKQEVYELYHLECRNAGVESASLSYFIQVWNARRNNLKCRRYHRFSKCDTCEALDGELQSIPLRDEEKRRSVTAKQREHWKFVAEERSVYYKAREKSRSCPEEHLSIIIDGADQACYRIPHWTFATKTSSAAQKLQMKMQGALVHKKPNHLFCAFMSEDQPCGANAIIEMLHRVLEHEKVKREGKMPPHLHLQLDNCSGQNKNRFFLGYCEALVMWGVFRDITLFFLPVGHTHEDIDQAFSRILARLRHHDAITLSDLSEQVKEGYKPYGASPSVFHMKTQGNISGLFQSTKILHATPIQGFTTYHWFCFATDGSPGAYDFSGFPVQCQVKKAGSDINSTTFRSTVQSRGVFLRELPDLGKTPDFLVQSPDEENWIALKKGVEACKERIDSSEKVNDLLELIDEVHTDKVLPFSWNLVSGIEMTGNFRPDYMLDNTGSGQESQEDMPPADVEEAEFECDVGDFVAVMAGEAGNRGKTFWLARILQLQSASSGTRRLKVHWYDICRLRKGQHDVGPLNARYKEGVDIVNGRQKPKTDSISMRTVLTVFPKLLNSGYIPVNAQKAIYTSLANARE